MAVRWDSTLQRTVDGLGHMWDSATQSWVGGGPVDAPVTGTTTTTTQGTGTGGNSAIGTQIPLDAATIAHYAAMDTNAAAQTANTSQANANTATYQQGMLTQQAAATAAQLEQARMQFAQTMAQNQAQYALDSAKFGQQVAQDNYNRAKDAAANKLLAAQFGMSQQQFLLSQNQFNAQQRQALAAAKLEIDKLIASKKGPDDWVAYNNLLNGMSKPTPTGTTVIDPYDSLKGMYEPSNLVAPAMPDLSINYTPSATPTLPAYPTTSVGGSGAGTGITPSTTPSGGSGVTWVGQGAPQTNSYGPGGNLLGQTVNHTGASGNTGEAGERAATGGAAGQAYAAALSGGGAMQSAGGTLSQTPPGSGYGVTPPAGQQIMPDGTVRNAPPRTVTPMATGGSSAGPVLVGDSKSGKPTGHEEIVYTRTDPKTGQSLIDVIPHDQIGPILDKHYGHHNGLVAPANKMPANLLAGLPRAAYGGTYGGYSQNGVQDQSKLQGQIPGENPIVNQGGPDLLGGTKAMPTPQQPQPMSAPGMGSGGMTGSTSGATAGQAPQPAPGVMANGASPTPSTVGTGLSSGNIAAAGSAGSNTFTSPITQPYTPDPAGSYGTAASSPYTVLNTYSPGDLGNQPFWQKILGNMPSRQFGNFGATLSNPKLGITNAPFNISLQRYNLLAPSEQKQLQSLYEQGLSVPWGDVEAAMNASAPVGHNRTSYGMGLQAASYGR